MRKTTEEWVELLHAYDPDKQTIKNYCAEHDIAVSSFYKYALDYNKNNLQTALFTLKSLLGYPHKTLYQ